MLLYDLNPVPETKVLGAHGRLHTQDVRQLRDWTTGSYAMKGIGGDEAISYEEIIYPLSGLFGPAVISTPPGAVTARQHRWNVPLVAPRNPVTKTIEITDAGGVRAHRASYVLETGITIKADPSKTTATGNVIAQQLTDPATPTPAPTRLPVLGAAALGTEWSVYRDYTAAALGTTKLSRIYEYDFDYSNVYVPHWTGDRALGGTYATHVDSTAFKTGVQLLMQADVAGMTGLADLRNDQIVFVRWQAVGSLLDNLWVLTIGGAPTGGSFTITYKGQTTAAIAWNAAVAAVQSALTALSSVGAGNATVTGAAGGPWTVALAGTLAQDTTLPTHTDSLTGGTAPALAIAQTMVSRSLTIDAALRYRGKVDIKDGADVIEVHYDLEVVEDPTWGQAVVVTAVNSLTGL